MQRNYAASFDPFSLHVHNCYISDLRYYYLKNYEVMKL